METKFIVGTVSIILATAVLICSVIYVSIQASLRTREMNIKEKSMCLDHGGKFYLSSYDKIVCY